MAEPGVQRAAIIGGGVIGSGWAARMLQNGIDVTLYDPDPEAERKLGAVLANADRARAKLTNAPPAPRGTLILAASLAEAVADADLVQESVPERIEAKKAVFAEVERHARPDALLASSTSGLLPSVMQDGLNHPERLLVAHPYVPVYLLPLVELVAGVTTAPEAIARAETFYAGIGMKPLIVRKEIDAFIGDRLLEAMWREALWLVRDDVATADEIDEVIRHSFGLRFAQMGLFLGYRIAGGEAGMRRFMEQFGVALNWPWTRLTDVPELSDALLDKIVVHSDAQAGGLSVRDLERIRDDNLIAIMQALRAQNGGEGWGAGAVLKTHEEQLFEAAHRAAAAKAHDISKPLTLVETRIPADWTDYNGHMTESRYLQIFGDTSDALMLFLGVDRAYRARGGTFFTAETHLVHVKEAHAMQPVHTTAQMLAADQKRMHVFYRMHDTRSGDLLATAEQMLLHVDTKAGKVAPAETAVAARLLEIADAHAILERPAQAGRMVGQRGSAGGNSEPAPRDEGNA